MRAFGPYIGRRPQWAGIESDLSSIVGGEVAAEQTASSDVSKSIMIGVATGALTFLVTRILEDIFFSKGRK